MGKFSNDDIRHESPYEDVLESPYEDVLQGKKKYDKWRR